MSEKEERPPSSLHMSTIELSPGHYATQLRCQFPTCEEMIRVELIAQHVAHTVDRGASDCRDARFFVMQYLRENGRPFSTALHLLKEDLYPKIEAALRQSDPDALFKLNNSYAPFYCIGCHSVYCYQHMNYREMWDEDYIEGGVDFWKGMCPYGHRQFVDH
jgi:hypothetical protein